MDYNTQRNQLIMPEYGRNIQKMVDYATEIKDKEKRNKAAKVIIKVIGNLNPHLRDVADFKHKLWDHLFIMSNFKLDVDSPFEKPKKETLSEKPKKLSYPQSRIKYRHYGKIIEQLIEKAKKLDEKDEKRDLLIHAIANHMKKSHINWNKEHVEDNDVFESLEKFSNNQIKTNRNIPLVNVDEYYKKRKRVNYSNHKNKRRNK